MSKQYFSILLVDDEDSIIEMLVESIKDWFPKADLDWVSNGRGALEKIKAKRYHFMITDFKMPVMDGGSLLKSLRNLDSRDIPRNILVLSSYLEPGEPSNEFANVSFMDKLGFRNKLKEYLKSKIRRIDDIQAGVFDESARVTPWRDEPIRVDVIKDDLIEIRFIKDISIRGLGISIASIPSLFSEGGFVDLVITLPKTGCLRTKGKVVHTGNFYSQSMGIEFVDLGATERKAIKGYIQRIMLNENW